MRVYFDTRNTRSQFHEMMAEATGEDPPFRQILVHDMGRLSRWAAGLSALRDRLEANGVTVCPSPEDRQPRPPEHGPTPRSQTRGKGDRTDHNRAASYVWAFPGDTLTAGQLRFATTAPSSSG